ncbi:MAG TPA: ArsR family transcriptional regulator [Dehalococcoidia bacterium]|nr:ArsR family transcriptional regulator [Dehalococcoidia bacterium]
MVAAEGRMQVVERHGERRQWGLLSSHGQVLVYVTAHPDVTVRGLANALNFSERRIMGVLRDLEQSGMLRRERRGRQNRYLVNEQAGVRAPEANNLPLHDLLAVLVPPGRREAAP